MTRFAMLLFFWSGIAFAQTHHLAEVWINQGRFYEGNINNTTDLRLLMDNSVVNAGSGQEYSVSGHSVVENTTTAFTGKIRIIKHITSRGQLTVSGDYYFEEDGKGAHSGIFKGKFKSTIKINRQRKQALRHQSEFTGNWQNYERTLNYTTIWKNQ